jgi:hypothetical protein
LSVGSCKRPSFSPLKSSLIKFNNKVSDCSSNPQAFTKTMQID